MRFVSRLVTEDRPLEVEAALAGIAATLDTVHLLLIFASPHFQDALERIARQARGRWPGVRILGCTGGGIIGGDHELEQAPALSLLAARLPGVTIEPFRMRQGDFQVPSVAQAAGVILLTDPYTIDSEAVLAALEAAAPGAPILGGLVSGGMRPYDNRVVLDDVVATDGAVGVILTGELEIEPVVAQGCRPIGPPLFITRAERNVLYSLDNRPAMAVLQEVLNGLEPEERELARQALFIGVLPDATQGRCGPGDYLVRNLVGLDPRSGALTVGARLQAHGVLRFHVRDAAASTAELNHLLGQTTHTPPPAGALMFSCLGRGERLFGVPDHDLDALQAHLGPLPAAGFFCNGEIGPVQGKVYLHAYTCSIALVRPKTYRTH